jgi:hypothetical protein
VELFFNFFISQIKVQIKLTMFCWKTIISSKITCLFQFFVNWSFFFCKLSKFCLKTIPLTHIWRFYFTILCCSWANVFLGEIFNNFHKYFFKRIFCHNFPSFKKRVKKILLLSLKLPKIITIAYNVKGCLRSFNFIFWILSNVAKYVYGWSSLE